jgi:NAD+ synthase (glutamine-hydrolysing)
MADRETIPAAIVDRPPARNSDDLPTFELLDPILKLHIEGQRLPAEEREAAQAVVQALDASHEGAALIARVQGLVARNEYKRRQAPPVIRVRARAFGSGREMPIAAQHRGAD